jgi:large subunit ribosomal protein L23
MNQERIFQVLMGPQISEKAAMVADAGNQVVFRVAPDASKLEVKHAVEKLFKVTVESVNMINQKGKVKRNRYGLAKRASVKKAYVRLAEGQEIDFSVAE